MSPRTKSAWGNPESHLFRFLRRVEAECSSRPHLCVVGCSDGKFVVPAARRGWRVTGVDIDPRMLWGSAAIPRLGIGSPVLGLENRLIAEQLLDRVTIYEGDFMELDIQPHDALWTSGCLQYSANSHHHISAMTKRLREILKPGRLAFIEYMVPDEPKLIGRPNCPPTSWWRDAFPRQGWDVLSHRELLEQRDLPHPYMPGPHRHSWGRVLARRAAE